jgi:hypothetical protein
MLVIPSKARDLGFCLRHHVNRRPRSTVRTKAHQQCPSGTLPRRRISQEETEHSPPANRHIEQASNQHARKQKSVTELLTGTLRNLRGTRYRFPAGFRGFSHSRFGGPGEKTPVRSTKGAAACPLSLSAEPQRLHCRRFAAKHKGFLAEVMSRAAPNRFPT